MGVPLISSHTRGLLLATGIVVGGCLALTALYLFMTWDSLGYYGQLFGHHVWPNHPKIAAFALQLLAAMLIVSAYRLWPRSAADDDQDHREVQGGDAQPHDDRHFDGAMSVLSWCAVVFGIAFLLQLLHAIGIRLVDALVVFHPWSGILLSGTVIVTVANDLWQMHAKRVGRREQLSSAGGTLLVIFAVYGILSSIVMINYEGFLRQSDFLSRLQAATPAEQLGFFAMPALFLTVVLTALVRYSYSGYKIRVFISFEHSREQTAAQISEALRRGGLTVRRIPFRPDYEHDRLLKQVQDEIHACDVMVCLPGSAPSFVENEVFFASGLRKFMVFVIGEKEPRLPNTAFYGYPAFRLERVQRLGYRPLRELIQLVGGNWRASFRYFFDSWSRVLSDYARWLPWIIVIFVLGSYLIGGVYALITSSWETFIRFLTGFHATYFYVLGDWDLVWIFVNLVLLGCVIAVINQLRTRRVLRQQTLTKHLTHDVLKEHLGKGKTAKRMLGCLWKRPIPAEHEPDT